MIQPKEIIEVPQGIEYIKQWTDAEGNFMLDHIIPSDRVIVNKMVTGCGFTTWSLSNNENTILVSPRLRLIREKTKKHPMSFYFNREADPKTKKPLKTLQSLEDELTKHINKCSELRIPIKIFVSYDSFCNLADMLERQGINICNTFRIAIDESHTIIKDVKMKEYNNKCVMSGFIKRLFTYNNLLFISATPIVEYVQHIPEFQAYPVRHIELKWNNVIPITQITYSCKSPSDAFDKIFDNYVKNRDGNGKNYFDVIYSSNGQAIYSYQACIFLNSVQDIQRILGKYINKLSRISTLEVTVICSSSNPNNEKLLQKVNPALRICKDVPGENDPHTTWTFVTRTSFEGVDFYSPDASTFVIANYHVDSLSLDVASDIPQIIGRQRRKDNFFRNTIHIYHTDNKKSITDAEYEARKQRVLSESFKQINIWDNAPDDCKVTALNNIATVIEKSPNDTYLKTVNGKPEIDELLIISDDYCRDIIRNHQTWFITTNKNACSLPYSQYVQALKNELDCITTPTATHDRLKRIYDYFAYHPSLHDEFFLMLHNEGYNSLAYYFNNLPLNIIYTLGCHPWKMAKKIQELELHSAIATTIASKFTKGCFYTKPEVKLILQEVYDSFGLQKTAKSTELEHYIATENTKMNGINGYRIL